MDWARARHRGLRRLAWVGLILVALAAVADGVYLAHRWPDWGRLATGPVPASHLIRRYRAHMHRDPHAAPLHWQPVAARRIPEVLVRAVVLAEDSRFFTHDGVDWRAVLHAAENDLERDRLAYGGSTISQQVVKNMFLQPKRTLLRKWHELILTHFLEQHLSKRRIMTIYLDVAELGPGIFGVEAAAQHYWHMDVEHIQRLQAAELAASLPDPEHDNPATRTAAFLHRRTKILGFFAEYGLGHRPWP